jgi:hypothetical protein
MIKEEIIKNSEKPVMISIAGFFCALCKAGCIHESAESG